MINTIVLQRLIEELRNTGEGDLNPMSLEYRAAEMLEAIAAERDSEWEYGWATDAQAQSWYSTREEAEEYTGSPQHFRRRKAGQWELA